MSDRCERCELASKAALFLGMATRDEWFQLQRMIDDIQADPALDYEKKFPHLRYPAVHRIYYEYPFRIIYRFAPPILFIDKIERAEFVPSAEDWDDWWKK